MTRIRAIFAARSWKHWRLVPLALVVIMSFSSSGTACVAAQTGSRAFPKTGKTVSGDFLGYWDAHGGLLQFGYPISDQMEEQSGTDGKTYTVQYFERAVFELHPELSQPDDVLLSLLGVFQYAQKYPNGAPGQNAGTEAGAQQFSQTGHSIGGKFLKYWNEHGGLVQQGYPISDEFTEVSGLDGKPYTVQYFERAVFEMHPENAGTPYDVLLSQLGTMRFHTRCASAAFISPDALAYLQEAITYVQENSIRHDRVDWAAIRDQALMQACTARTTADTYPAIRTILAALGDRHSNFYPPDEEQQRTAASSMGLSVSYADRRVEAVAPGSPAEEAGVLAGDTIELINDKPVSSMDASTFFVRLYGGLRANLTLTRVGQKQPVEVSITHDALPDGQVPHGRRLVGNIGYISLPYNGGRQVLDEYGSILQQIIRDIDQTPTRGWIVDLQLDAGGTLSPMVLGVGPILGDGNAGAFMFANGEKIVWSYHNGEYWYGNEVLRRVSNPYTLKQPMPPVAVLTSSGTGSSGEATLISFRGRPQTRSFGEPTSGLPTGREGIDMSDGALIAIATALEADRTGHIYGADEKIAPDQYVQVDYNLTETGSDPVMLAGLAWLQTQAQCAK